ncbi:hypothetical protein JTB14_000282 [Gonioctena quinquepunctata]|nr:hypothetical protein JTB14_000282 [Gonioctena quinquepunctata]
MEKNDRNIPPDEGIKDKPPKKRRLIARRYRYLQSTPIRQGKDTVQENWSKSDNIEQVELLENNAISDTNIEYDSVSDSTGEIKHTSEVRETGSLGSIASLAHEMSDYCQFVVPNNSHSPSNASSADESIQDIESIDNSLNQTIRPNIYSGRKILAKNREIFRSESESEAEELGYIGQFKVPKRPLRRSSRIVVRTLETHSDSEILPSPKRKRKDSPDEEEKNMNKIKELLIQDSEKLSLSEQLISLAGQARLIDSLCECGHVADKEHRLLDAQDGRSLFKCMGSIELTEKKYGRMLMTMAKYIAENIEKNTEFNSAYNMEVVNTPDQENSKIPSLEAEPESPISGENKYIADKSDALAKERRIKK